MEGKGISGTSGPAPNDSPRDTPPPVASETGPPWFGGRGETARLGPTSLGFFIPPPRPPAGVCPRGTRSLCLDVHPSHVWGEITDLPPLLKAFLHATRLDVWLNATYFPSPAFKSGLSPLPVCLCASL